MSIVRKSSSADNISSIRIPAKPTAPSDERYTPSDNRTIISDNPSLPSVESPRPYFNRPVRSAVPIPWFDDIYIKETVEKWMFKFEMCAKANCWTDEDKISQVYFGLRGNAEKCYTEIMRNNRNVSWDFLKNALIKRFTRNHARMNAM